MGRKERNGRGFWLREPKEGTDETVQRVERLWGERSFERTGKKGGRERKRPGLASRAKMGMLESLRGPHGSPALQVPHCAVEVPVSHGTGQDARRLQAIEYIA